MTSRRRPARVVLDTDVVIAAMRSGSGASSEVIRLVRVGELEWVVSLPLFFEYLEVCTRSDHAKAARERGIDPTAFMQDLAGIVQSIEVDVKWRGILADPDDDKTLEVALNAGAAIVTFNIRDYSIATRRFVLQVMTPSDLLRRYRND